MVGPRPRDAVEVFQPGLNMFLVCQQVYHEAASIFYSANTFFILGQNDSDKFEYHWECDGDIVSQTLDSWLTQLGGQCVLLKKIKLDLDCICRAQCKSNLAQPDTQPCSSPLKGSAMRDVEAVHLLKAVWAHNLQAKIILVQTRNMIRSSHWDSQPSKPYRFHSMIPMSKSLHALCRDRLDIKKFRRTLGSVTVNKDGSSGLVEYWTTNPHLHAQDEGHAEFLDMADKPATKHVCADTAIPFTRDSFGKLQVQKITLTVAFGNLPSHLRDRVFDMVMSDESACDIVMDSCQGFNTVAALLYLNRSYRKRFLSPWTTSVFTLRTSTTSTRGSFPNIHKFERLFSTQMNNFGDGLKSDCSWGIHANFHILLVFRIATQTDFENLRTDIVPFLLATSKTWNNRDVTFQLETPGLQRQEITVSLGSLRRRVLVALQSYAGSPLEPCPRVWVDGHGRVKETVRKEPVVSEVNDMEPDTIKELNSGHGINDIGNHTGGSRDRVNHRGYNSHTEYNGTNNYSVDNLETHNSDEDPSSKQPSCPNDSQLERTVQSLEWVLRFWQKTH
jgi:hypothetical protein